MLVSWPLRGFGAGLNLRDKVDAIREDECIDTLNTIFTETGTVKQRDGYDQFEDVSVTIAERPTSMVPYYNTSGDKQLVFGSSTRIRILDNDGTSVGEATGLTAGTWDFARFGGPSAEYLFAGNGNDSMYRWNGTSLTTSTGGNVVKPGALAVMAVDKGNRMVIGRFLTATGGPDGATTNKSRIWFSDAGSPHLYSANNFLDLTPGDGEGIQAIVAWREFVFVFKQTKFFRIDGSSEDAGGNPVFHYTTFDTGVGLANTKAYAVTERGIFFLAGGNGATHGVYFTNGGEPVEVSDLVQPIFTGGVSDYYLGGELDPDQLADADMTSLDDRVYLAFSTNGSYNNRLLVFDAKYEWWSVWDIPASSLTTLRVTGSDHSDVMFGYATGGVHIGRINSSYTSDDGSAITSRWRSGWFDFSIPEQKRVRQWKVWGNSTAATNLSTSLQTDFLTGVGTAVTLDLTNPGSAPVQARMANRSARGTVFSLYFANSTLDKTWSVNRATLHIADQRPPSVTQTDGK